VQPDDGEMTVDPPSQEPSVLQRLEKRDIQSRVQDCIKVLEPEYREIIVLPKDLDAAEKKIEKAVTQLGGKIIAKEPFENTRTVTAAIDSNKVKKLMERLKPAGDVKEKETPFVSRDGGIEIRIELNKI
jgi:hypothetical protein